VTRAELRQRFEVVRPQLVEDLADLVAIPSVAFDGYPREPLDRARDLVVSLLGDAGLDRVWTIELADSGAAVAGERGGPDGAPTVLLYAHYDVQPADAARWHTPPFELTEVGGRLYGRGAADDKSGIVAHVAALRAHGGAPPVHVKVVVEGGEENGKEALGAHVTANPAWFADADVVVVADTGPWVAGDPVITTSLRGDCDVTVEVRTLESARHSGDFGGPVPDALSALARVLATLHDEAGDVAVPGLDGGEWQGAPLDEERFRRSAGVVPGVELLGTGTLSSRLWSRPAISVLGIDAPAVRDAPSALVPAARAKLNLRIPPGLDPERARDALLEHLLSLRVWGAAIQASSEPPARGIAVAPDGWALEAAERAFADAYGKPTETIGAGGSIPLAATLQQVAPHAEILLVGAEDADACNMHAPDESVAIYDLERFALAEALLLAELAEAAATRQGGVA
jgi:acetylornithine deacetylase/succinyl-diaminopimelate desuccinylase-like protein